MSEELPKSYDASTVEDNIYKHWLETGYFNPDNLPDAKNRKAYTIVLPPLNVTGTLHMGHAYEDTIQDILIRFKRMQGLKTLWLPGTDHAAIATQSKVEKEIYKHEEKSRYDLGRDEFLKRVEEFALGSHDIIVNQLKKMGASVDWSREGYTLDATRNRAVKTAFKRFYDLGLIYKGLRIVNWDPKGQTTISDDEIVREERPGKLYTFKYSKDFPIAISTSRPETKVGDTAVAVHPEDKRYQKYIGQEYDIEFAGTKLHIKIVADESVEQAFGTGALGVTPAHSQIDWEIAEKNNLPHKQVIDEHGRMVTDAGNLQGKKITEARELIVDWIRTQGLLEKEEDVVQNIGLSERTKGIIEPLPKEQWFINVNKQFKIPHSELKGINSGDTVTLKSLMRHVVETGQIKIIPEHFEKIYFHWIDNLRDWCISRQIWFGHRIPVWYDQEGKHHLPNEFHFYLARHAECEANAANILPTDDSKLTSLGKDQAKQLAQAMRDKNITKIIASTLTRSQETAHIVATELGLTKEAVETWEEIREIHVGHLQGKPEDPNLHGFAQAQKEATGESLDSIEQRVKVALSKLEKLQAQEKLLIIGHGGFNAVLQACLEGRKKEDYVAYRTKLGNIPNASYKELIVTQDPQEHGLRQDEDTFDTWFSSGLWTFSTLGWPNQTQDLAEFHPTSVIDPGYEILQLWIARMILMSTSLVGQVPFHTAFIHGLVRDKQGRKFSKSLNNGVDPLEMTEKYGTDALRMALIFSSAPGNDVAFDEQKIKGMKHFANKLWNIARFVITNHSPSPVIPDSTSESASAGNLESILKPGSRLGGRDDKSLQYVPTPQTDADKEVLDKLESLTKEVTQYLEDFQLHEAAQALYQFIWHEFADIYIEKSKEQLNNETTKQNTNAILIYCLNVILLLLHPFMPFITEHIASLLTERGLRMYSDPLLVSKWPEA